MVTASSVADGEHLAWRTLDTRTETLWRSQAQTRPWLAVDLISSHLVWEVAFSESDDTSCVTHHIEVRVGFGRPFQHKTGGETVYQHNRVCGLFPGPGTTDSWSRVSCAGKGRFQKYLLHKLVEFLINGLVGSQESIKLKEVIFSIQFFQFLCFPVLKFGLFCHFFPLRPRWVGGVKV